MWEEICCCPCVQFHFDGRPLYINHRKPSWILGVGSINVANINAVEVKVILPSLSSAATSWTLPFDRHSLAKWFGRLHLAQILPQAGHWRGACGLPQRLHFSCCFFVVSITGEFCGLDLITCTLDSVLELVSHFTDCIDWISFLVISAERHMSITFCKLVSVSLKSLSFSVFSLVENTILSLIILSASKNSQDRDNTLKLVKYSSKGWTSPLWQSQNWYLENTTRFIPANSRWNLSMTSLYFALSSPVAHVKWLKRSRASDPIAERSHAIFMSSSFESDSVAVKYNSKRCRHLLQFSEGLPWRLSSGGGLKSLSIGGFFR